MKRVVALLTAVAVMFLTLAVAPSASAATPTCRQVGSGLVAPCGQYPEPTVCAKVRVAAVRAKLPGCSRWDAYVELRYRVANKATRQATVSALFKGIRGNAAEVASASLNTSSVKGKIAYFESIRIVDDMYASGQDLAKAVSVLDIAQNAMLKVVGVAYGKDTAKVIRYCSLVADQFFRQFTSLAMGTRLRADAVAAYGALG